MMKKVRKAVLPVAGLGTRFLPATKAIPKEMLPLVDTPSIQLIVEECVAAGIEEIIFVTARGKSAIEDHFDRAGELESLLQSRGKQRGSGAGAPPDGDGPLRVGAPGGSQGPRSRGAVRARRGR